jgi:hypothetical protein
LGNLEIDLPSRPIDYPIARLPDYYYFVTSMISDRTHAALRTARRRGKTPLQEAVYSAGQVRDLAWTRPYEAFSRLPRASRRSHGSLPQHVSGLSMGGKVTE